MTSVAGSRHSSSASPSENCCLLPVSVKWNFCNRNQIFISLLHVAPLTETQALETRSHGSIEHFDCVLDVIIGRDGLQKITKYVNSGYPWSLMQGLPAEEEKGCL